MQTLRVGIVGTGYVGTVVGACLAHVGHTVTGLEIDPHKLARLRQGDPPFFEAGLDEVLAGAVRSGRLTFTDDPGRLADAADVVFLCLGTPSRPDGGADMSAVEAAAASIARVMTRPLVFVTKSTVPIGSGNWLATVVEEAQRDAGREVPFSVVSNPEFLREGAAVGDFLHPDRIVLGGDDPGAVDLVTEVYRPILEQTFQGGRGNGSRPKLVHTARTTAETVKYAANAFLATKISFANEIANICELVGADVREVMAAIGSDHRIGAAFLDAGAGWGGSCFGKDLRALVSTAEGYGYEPSLLRATIDVNARQRARIVDKLQSRLKTLQGRRIALLGLSFKPGTDDLRDAPAVDVASRLLLAGAFVTAHDPMVAEVPGLEGLRILGDAYAAAERADAVVLMTEWPEYRDLEPLRLRNAMRGRTVVDARNALPSGPFAAVGLLLEGIGVADTAGLPDPIDVRAVTVTPAGDAHGHNGYGAPAVAGHGQGSKDS